MEHIKTLKHIEVQSWFGVAYSEWKAVEADIQVMKWPSQSPNLNPIELISVWQEVHRRVRLLHPIIEEDLWRKLQDLEVWAVIEPEHIDKLFKGCPTPCTC